MKLETRIEDEEEDQLKEPWKLSVCIKQMWTPLEVRGQTSLEQDGAGREAEAMVAAIINPVRRCTKNERYPHESERQCDCDGGGGEGEEKGEFLPLASPSLSFSVVSSPGGIPPPWPKR